MFCWESFLDIQRSEKEISSELLHIRCAAIWINNNIHYLIVTWMAALSFSDINCSTGSSGIFTGYSYRAATC